MVATVRIVALQWQRAIVSVGGGRPSGDVSVARFVFVWAQLQTPRKIPTLLVSKGDRMTGP